jgi:hypothetical protein
MAMKPVTLNVFADPHDLINDLVADHTLDLTEFILALDADVCDEGFTIELVKGLVKSLLADRESYVENLAKKSLEQTLLPPDEEAERFRNSFPGTDYTKEWEEELRRYEIFTEVVRLLGKLQ